MAFHPFRTFQRNQKGCMAGATLLAIISFLFLGVILQMVGGGRGGGPSGNETIAESRRYGKISAYDLERLRNNQEVLRRFLVILSQNIAGELIGKHSIEEIKMILEPLAIFTNQVMQTQSSEPLVNLWLISQYVQEEGLSPDWDNISSRLRELTNGNITDTAFDDTLQSIGITKKTIEPLLARQIQWEQALARFNQSVSTVSPATRWDWFQRLYRSVTVEAAVVSVDAFTTQVGEPSEKQLTAFFEQHKSKRYNPMLADSGFIMPTELAFQYVLAKPTQKLLDSITDEEILAFYEEHKEDLFRRRTGDIPQFPGMMPGGVPFPTPGLPGRTVTPMIPMLPDLPGTDDMLPEQTTTEEESDGSEETATESPIDEPQSEENNDQRTSESGEEESVPETSEVTMRFVSYQADEEEPADDLAGTPAEETTPTIDDDSQPGIMIPVTPRIIIQEEEEDFTMLPTGAVASDDTTGELPTVPAEEAEDDTDLSILYQPFDDVKDQIRTMLAQDKAVAALPVIREKMQEYAKIYNENFELSKAIPAMPDLTGFVAEQGLELVTVPMGDVFTAVQLELARGNAERRYLVQKFDRIPLLFDGEISEGSIDAPMQYPLLSWVTAEKPELRPDSLNEVREIVLKRWKEVEARALALNKAEELAAEAKASRRSLADVFAGRREVPVVDTEPFTWMTYHGLPPIMATMYRLPPPVVSEVLEKGIAVGNSGVDNELLVAPGWDFMETVFSLQVGESGVVFNQPQTCVYVVRVTSSSPSDEALWEQYQTTPIRVYFPAGSQEMLASAFGAWLEEIREKAGFRWINRPNAREWERFDGED